MSDNASANVTGEKLKVVVYSSDRLVREQVRLALGGKVAADLPEVEIYEFATAPAALKAMDAEIFDVAVFDAEAVPGGMGLTHQIKDEIPGAPPVVLLVARVADVWLATWSKADAISPYPIDPLRLPADVAQVVRDARVGRGAALSAPDQAPGAASRHGVDDEHGVPGLVGTPQGPSGAV